MKIKIPAGYKLKTTRRKTNFSKTILITVNKDTVVDETAETSPRTGKKVTRWLHLETVE